MQRGMLLPGIATGVNMYRRHACGWSTTRGLLGSILACKHKETHDVSFSTLLNVPPVCIKDWTHKNIFLNRQPAGFND